MNSKRNIIIILGVILVSIIIDILVRLFYCTAIHLKFNSQEFNNIASPIISFMGFIGLTITILIALNQFKHQQSINYFNYYDNYINNIETNNLKKNEHIQLSITQLLNFHTYADDMYDELKNFPEYFNDLERFKSGVNISSDNKPYDKVLEGVRVFNAKLILTLRQFKSLIKEIDTHKILDITHKEILLKKFFDTHVDEYISGCLVMETDNDLKIIAESFYIGFATKFGDKQKFFSSDFYDLKKMIFDTPRLKNIYYSS